MHDLNHTVNYFNQSSTAPVASRLMLASYLTVQEKNRYCVIYDIPNF